MIIPRRQLSARIIMRLHPYAVVQESLYSLPKTERETSSSWILNTITEWKRGCVSERS